TDDVPRVVGANLESALRRRAIIDGDEAPQAQERLRLALLEDMLAEAFARDLGEEVDGLRSRLMAAVAVNGLRAVSLWWYRHHSNGTADPRYPYALDATYVT